MIFEWRRSRDAPDVGPEEDLRAEGERVRHVAGVRRVDRLQEVEAGQEVVRADVRELGHADVAGLVAVVELHHCPDPTRRQMSV